MPISRQVETLPYLWLRLNTMSHEPTSESADSDAALEAAATHAARAVVAAPDHRDMYLLLLGLIVGLGLSPWILGKYLDENAFTKWYYYGNAPAFDDLAQFIEEQQDRTLRKKADVAAALKLTDATEQAIHEKIAEIDIDADAERRPYVDAVAEAREQHRVWMQSFIFTLAIAAAALMFIEPLFDPTSRLAGLRRRLTTGRYAIMAVWVGAVLAKPHFIAMPLVPVLILLMAISLLAAALPWLLAGKRDMELRE